ncbi:MAG: hypothetical protein NTV70_06970 [Acidobacteria bacterium]|nr:hypothetical protein [Acidobacteriota bacterium]
MNRFLLASFAALIGASAAFAHVGSPDVFFEGKAGEYRVFVTIRTPQVIPGVAEVELRFPEPGVEQVKITPTPLTGLGAKFAPTADTATRSQLDPQSYAGSLWMMSSGEWQVRINVTGQKGTGELRVPVPALAQQTMGMDPKMAGALLALMVFLAVGIVSIFGAASREGKLPPGEQPSPTNIRRARIVMAATAVAVVGIIFLGNQWWGAEAADYSRKIFKPLAVKPTLNGRFLNLQLEHTGWMQSPAFDDLVPDHGYLMHLFVVAKPGQGRIWHLHPALASNGVFTQDLSSLPAGKYQLLGDIVHRSGLPETVVAELDIPADLDGGLKGDDSTNSLSDGLKMVMESPATLKAKSLQVMKFKLLDAGGQPATGMELYLGMPAHAAVLRDDFSVFSHLHPSGTVPAASLAMAQPADGKADPHAGHSMSTAELPAEVTFPYGFPEPGNYKMFVQMKRAGKVETGVFAITVTN